METVVSILCNAAVVDSALSSSNTRLSRRISTSFIFFYHLSRNDVSRRLLQLLKYGYISRCFNKGPWTTGRSECERARLRNGNSKATTRDQSKEIWTARCYSNADSSEWGQHWILCSVKFPTADHKNWRVLFTLLFILVCNLAIISLNSFHQNYKQRSMFYGAELH